jgi:hypothetical protein
MKLEPIPSTETAGSQRPESGPLLDRLTLDDPAFAGRSFTVTFNFCCNPCCPCGTLDLNCRSDQAPGNLLDFSLDLFQHQLTPATLPDEDRELGKAFVAEAQEADWERLMSILVEAKRQQMETMDLDTLQVDFPPDITAGYGTMVAHEEIFPWGERFNFEHDGQEWLADDQHCVQPGCDCTMAGLSFLRTSAPAEADGKDAANPLAAPPEAGVSLWLDHRTGAIKIRNRKPGTPKPEALVESLRRTHPRLLEQLSLRAAQLQQLGRRLLARHLPRSPVAAAPKIGRNDLCPCGSGKKFKKCCGAA